MKHNGLKSWTEKRDHLPNPSLWITKVTNSDDWGFCWYKDREHNFLMSKYMLWIDY